MPDAATAPLNGHSARQPSAGLTFSGLTPLTDFDESSPHQLPTTGEGPSIPSPAAPLDGSPSEHDEPSDELPEDDDPRPTGTRSSAGRRAAERAQQAAARKAVRMTATMLHARLARDEAAQAAGVFLMDDDTAEGIADPLARIAARHLPDDSAIANPDVADGISAMMGIADYVRLIVEQQQLAAQLRVGAAPEPVDAQTL